MMRPDLKLPSAEELLEGTSECVFLLDPHWRFTYLNQRATDDIAGGRDLTGRCLWEEFPKAKGTLFEENYTRAMQKREQVYFEADFAPLSARYQVQVRPLSAGGIGIWFRNITGLKERETQLANIYGQGIVGIMEVGADGRPRMANSRFCQILGRTMEELKNCTFRDYTHPDDLEWFLPLAEIRHAAGAPLQVEKRYVRPDGSIVPCRVDVSFVRGPSGEVESAIAIAEERTEQKQAELALRETEQLYRDVMEASADCIKVLDLEGRLVLMNSPGVCAMEIGTFERVRGMEWAELWPEESRNAVRSAVDDAKAGLIARFSAFCPTAAGTPKWWDVVVTPMFNDNRSVTRLLSISRDITVQRESAVRTKWSSEHDALTRIPNRRAFEAHLQAATIRAMESGGQVGLLLLDLDYFKHVNDSLGHAAGDHLLRVFAKRLQVGLPGTGFAARLGGDEFAVILEGPRGGVDLLAAGDALLKRLRRRIRYDGRYVSAAASIGCASYPADAENAHELLKNADIALYALKESGRGGTKLFHPRMREQAQIVSAQLSLARVAITERSVEPHYQQKVDLRTGRIAGFEALLRWRHGTQGIQAPDTVAEAFNHFELASRIGELMQRRVFSDLRTWLGNKLPVGFVAINASPAEFLRNDFAERFLARLREFEVPPSSVEVEITEHVFLGQSSEYVSRALEMLDQAGVRIALDDFGTGHSSLSHLRDFPVHVVKIDRSFVERMPVDPGVRAIVSAVVDLAKSLSIEVVAEGVETGEQRRLLIEDGCEQAQGFYFGRAVHADEVPVLLNGVTRRVA
jgi:diguanylate cyclase (GGDEF)-like protein/PAS domain S-box-containing protein